MYIAQTKLSVNIIQMMS